MNRNGKKIVIIGGGIAGLCTAGSGWRVSFIGALVWISQRPRWVSRVICLTVIQRFTGRGYPIRALLINASYEESNGWDSKSAHQSALMRTKNPFIEK